MNIALWKRMPNYLKNDINIFIIDTSYIFVTNNTNI